MSSTEPSKGSLRKFGIVFAFLLALFALLSLWRGRGTLVLPFSAVSSVFLLASLVYPRILAPLYSLMLKVSGYMGWFNTRLILILVYYLVFTPIAILFKLMRKDPLERRFDPGAHTYWKRREEGERDTVTHYEKQF